jgi:(-)-alpha-terpineol synthase
MLVHVYFSITNPITKEALDCLEEFPNIIRWSAVVLRLADDLGTSKVCKPKYIS